MSDVRYAVHTKTCTYLLDEEGVCRWILSSAGRLSESVQRCVGAQFVACLDPRVPGSLSGELAIGAAALFVAAGEGTSGRLVLLRTAPITNVDVRDPSEATPRVSFPAGGDEGDAAPPSFDPADVETTQDLGLDELELLPIDDATVTVTLPLYRPRARRS